MAELIEFRLDGGTNQQAAKRLLPADGKLLARVENMRLRVDNELEQRPAYTAMSRTTYAPGTTLTVYDVVNYNERLVAIGQNGNGTRPYEFVNQAAASWKAAAGSALPYATNFRDMGRPPDQADEIQAGTVAVDDGIALLAFSTQDGGGYYHVFRVADDATLVFENYGGAVGEGGSPRAIVTDAGLFVAVAYDSALGSLRVRDFAPATSSAMSGVTTLFSVSSGLFAAAPVRGGAGYVVCGPSAGGIIIRHYSDTHVQQMTVTIATTVAKAFAIGADSAGNTVSILYIDNADDVVRCITRQLTTGNAVQGPTAISSGTIAQALSVVSLKYVSSTSMRVAYTLAASGATVADQPHFVQTRTIVPSTHALGTVANHFSAEMTSEVLVDAELQPIFAHVYGENLQRVNVLTEHNGPLLAGKDFGIAEPQGSTTGRVALSLTRDDVSGKYYWVNHAKNNDGQPGVTVTQFELHSTARRQMAQLGGLLYISGGMLMVYDGRMLVESGFIEAPMLFIGLAGSASAGSATPLAAYHVQLHAEWMDSKRNVHLSPPSIVYSLTLAALQTRLSGAVMGLHTMRRVDTTTDAVGSSFRYVIHRTAALTNLTAGENLFRERIVNALPGSTFGAARQLSLEDSDATLRAKLKTIYTQSQTPIPHCAPPPSRYVWPTSGRLHLAGLPQPDLMVHSKLLFPAEPVEFAPPSTLGFESRFESDLGGVFAVDEVTIGLTRSHVYEVTGEGPGHNGQGEEFKNPRQLPTDGGLVADGWPSICEIKEGVFYQADSDKLFFMTRARVSEWVGQEVQAELALYPKIVAATHCRDQHCVAFACQATNGATGAILVYDLQKKAWFIDPFNTPAALATYQGRLVVVDTNGLPYLQDLLPGTGAMPTQVIELFSLDFGTTQSWGELQSVGATGEYRGDATLALAISSDDGLNYTTIGTWAITAANGYTTGKPFDIRKTPPDRTCARYRLKFTVTGGSGSSGLRINTILVEPQKLPGASRLPARDTQ